MDEDIERTGSTRGGQSNLVMCKCGVSIGRVVVRGCQLWNMPASPLKHDEDPSLEYVGNVLIVHGLPSCLSSTVNLPTLFTPRMRHGVFWREDGQTLRHALHFASHPLHRQDSPAVHSRANVQPISTVALCFAHFLIPQPMQ